MVVAIYNNQTNTRSIQFLANIKQCLQTLEKSSSLRSCITICCTLWLSYVSPFTTSLPWWLPILRLWQAPYESLFVDVSGSKYGWKRERLCPASRLSTVGGWTGKWNDGGVEVNAFTGADGSTPQCEFVLIAFTLLLQTPSAPIGWSIKIALYLWMIQ